MLSFPNIKSPELSPMDDRINKTEEGSQEPPFCSIVSGYLWGIDGKPTGTDRWRLHPESTRVFTSQEIVLALADMADLELNDVARCMIHLGYVCGSIDGNIGWLVQISRH